MLGENTNKEKQRLNKKLPRSVDNTEKRSARGAF
jgi:hypothetical protein